MTAEQQQPLVEESGTEPVKSAATILVELAMEQHQFMVSTDGEAFAVPTIGPKIVRQLRGGKLSLRAELDD